MRRLPDVLIEPVVRLALAEDLGRAGDMTAIACIPEGARMKAAFVARKPGVLAGIDCVRLAVLAMDAEASVDVRLRDGAAFEAGAVLAVVEADARAFLSAERTALNLVGRLSGGRTTVPELAISTWANLFAEGVSDVLGMRTNPEPGAVHQQPVWSR